MSDTDVLERVAPPMARTDGEHILEAEGDVEEPFTVVIMFCGQQGVIGPDGELLPPAADHYHPHAGDRAQCQPCRTAWLAAGQPHLVRAL
jgi:hypothetical protein